MDQQVKSKKHFEVKNKTSHEITVKEQNVIEANIICNSIISMNTTDVIFSLHYYI